MSTASHQSPWGDRKNALMKKNADFSSQSLFRLRGLAFLLASAGFCNFVACRWPSTEVHRWQFPDSLWHPTNSVASISTRTSDMHLPELRSHPRAQIVCKARRQKTFGAVPKKPSWNLAWFAGSWTIVICTTGLPENLGSQKRSTACQKPQTS